MNIFITGANQGIGYYLAEGLLELGHRVTVLDVETTKLPCKKVPIPMALLISPSIMPAFVPLAS